MAENASAGVGVSNAKKQWTIFGVICVAVLLGGALGAALLLWLYEYHFPMVSW